VAGQGVAGLAIDQEADLGQLREGGVEGADDGVDRQVFDGDAGGVGGDEGSVEVDDGELCCLFCCLFRQLFGFGA